MAKLPAGTYKRTNGTLEKRFTIDGKRYSVYGKTSKELMQKETELRKKIESGVNIESAKLTLDGYFQQWQKEKLTEVKNGNMHESTVRNYSSIYCKNISPVLGTLKIQKIEKRHIKLFLEGLEDKAPNTYNHILHIVNMILNDAVRDEVIQRNPASGIRGKKADKTIAQKGKHKALTLEEQRAFMNAMREDFYYEYIALMLGTGMRCGEVAALRWADIDFKKKQIHVQRTKAQGMTSIYVGETKSKSGNRIIPITDAEISVLKSQRQKMRDLFGNVSSIEQPVFLSVNGNMPSAPVINRAIEKAIERANDAGANIQPFSAHALRDTYATRWIEQSNDYKTLQVILGHSSLTMTMDRYAQVLEDKRHEERAKVSILL